MTPVLSVVDLFAGVGGFSEGFLRVNRTEKKFQFALKLLVDSDPTASFTFRRTIRAFPFGTQTSRNSKQRNCSSCCG